MKRLFALLFLAPLAAFSADTSSPETWADSGPNATFNAARLTSAFGGITILPNFISDKADAAPILADSIVYFQSGSTTLKKATVSELFSIAPGLTNIGLTLPSIFSVTGSPRTSNGTIAATLINQNPGAVLAGPIVGAAATPAFRHLVSQDLAVPTLGISAQDVNWAGAATFTRTVTTNTTFTFSNALDGQSIIVVVKQDATGSRTVTWPTVSWQNGSAPVATTTPNASDIYCFIKVGSTFYGSVSKNY